MESSEPKGSVDKVIDDEVLRARIRKIADEPPSPSRWKALSTSPLTAIVLGFVLTGILGASLTYYYNRKQADLEYQRTQQQKEIDFQRAEQQREIDYQRTLQQRRTDQLREDAKRESDRQYDELQRKRDAENNRLQKERDAALASKQQELAREHSFSDELNKVAVQKIAEVWESVYAYESAYQNYLPAMTRSAYQEGNQFGVLHAQGENSEAYKEATKQYEEAKARLVVVSGTYKQARDELHGLLQRNRFWLGEDIYGQVQEYVDASAMLAKELRLGTSLERSKGDKEINALQARTDRLRLTLQRIRDQMLHPPASSK